MKKSILFILSCIPMLASCNNDGNGFPNPFPEDQYPRIGFNIAPEEMMKNPLTSQETNLVDETYANLDKHNSKITKVEGQIHERNYERAFAGEFKKGYATSNMMLDEEFSSIRDDKLANHIIRQETNRKTTTVVDYAYGKSKVESTTKGYKYLAYEDTTTTPSTYKESPKDGSPTLVLEQVLEMYGSESTSISVTTLQEKPEPEPTPAPDPWYDEKLFEIPMTGYFFPTTEATTLPGVTKDGEIVLIKETHTPYGEKGIYSLPDGREYEAMTNSVIVTRLIKPVAPNEDQDDWYIVNHVRKYSETAITSDVIQPNVPISYLAHPIVISFKEEKYHFSIDNVESEGEIPPVEIN